MSHRTRDLSARPDARSPFVFDTRALGRQPGSSRTMRRRVPAPATFCGSLVGVAEGADLELDLLFEAVMEGVLVSAAVRAPVSGACARCLDPFTSFIEVEFQELFCYPAAGDAGSEATEEDCRLDGDLLDLEQACRDAVLLALPLSPLCSDDCPGLCAECGARLADLGRDHGHGHGVHPRWAALRQLDVAGTMAPPWIDPDHKDDRQEA